MARTRRPASTSQAQETGAKGGRSRSTAQARQAEREIVVTLRLPRELHARLQALGGPRGLTAQIRDRLEASFAAEPDPRFVDLLAALAHAATAAGRMFPARKVTVSESLARRIGADSREVEDTDAYWLFEACAADLIGAFHRDGVSGRLSEHPQTEIDEYRAEIGRASDRIVGAALGQLGERGAEAFSRLPLITQESIASSGPLGERLAREAARIAETRDEQ